MHHTTTKQQEDSPEAPESAQPSVLTALRALLPKRPLQLFEALRLAELQANQLRALTGVGNELTVPNETVTHLPRIVAEYDPDMPVSGASDWDTHRHCWVITLNALEPETRQRFSLFHEYKHVLDHGGPGLLVISDRTYYGLTPDEYVADYFAGCVLMPKRLLKRAWGDGIQRASDLAELFDVSERAMRLRLNQLRLPQLDVLTTAHVVSTPKTYIRARRGSYHRQLSTNWPSFLLTEEIAR